MEDSDELVNKPTNVLTNYRFTQDDLQAISAAASFEGFTSSAWVRRELRARVAAVLKAKDEQTIERKAAEYAAADKAESEVAK